MFEQCRKKQGKDPSLWRGQRHTSYARTLGASCYSLPGFQPNSFSQLLAQPVLPAAQPPSDKVKPKHHCFPKALPPVLLKHRTSQVLLADLEKCKITQRLPQARSFCILGKKLHDKEDSMRATEEEKKSGRGNLPPKTGLLIS